MSTEDHTKTSFHVLDLPVFSEGCPHFQHSFRQLDFCLVVRDGHCEQVHDFVSVHHTCQHEVARTSVVVLLIYDAIATLPRGRVSSAPIKLTLPKKSNEYQKAFGLNLV